MPSHRLVKLGAGLALVATLSAACGNNNDSKAAATKTAAGHETPAEQADHGSATATGVDSPASGLRAGLTSLLQEHVYLAGVAVSTGLGSGLDSPAFSSAAATLDLNSVALSQAVGSVYGDAAGKQFLDLWRKHIGFFVDYTKGKATKDQAMADKAKADLDGYRADFGAFLASANPNLTKDAVAQELVPHVQSLFDAIDAAVAKSPDVYPKLRTAAGHMPMTADVLSGAIAKQFPDKFPG